MRTSLVPTFLVAMGAYRARRCRLPPTSRVEHAPGRCTRQDGRRRPGRAGRAPRSLSIPLLSTLGRSQRWVTRSRDRFPRPIAIACCSRSRCSCRPGQDPSPGPCHAVAYTCTADVTLFNLSAI
jgi:hypothetical protein